MKIVELELKDLHIPQGFLPRILTGTVEEKVEEYAEMIEQGVELDPIVVWKRPDGQFWILDGNHRYQAHKRAGKEKIKAIIREDIRDEVEFLVEAIKANLKHGVALKPEERIDNARRLYRMGVSEEKIREIFGVLERTVREWLKTVKEEERREKIKKALELREKGYTQEQIAKELGVPRRTVADWLAKSEVIAKSAKIALLTPSGEPTPEGLRLWSEYVEQADVKTPQDAFDVSAFYTFLKNKGYEAEKSKEFLSSVRDEVNKYIKNAVNNGLDQRDIKLFISRGKMGIFRNISSTAKAKLAGLLTPHIQFLIKERERLKELEEEVLKLAKEILKDPNFIFSNWTDLALKVREKRGDELPLRGSADTHEIADILRKHSDELMEIYRQIPEAEKEEIEEIASSFDLDEFESLEQFRETLKAQVIQEGKRPAGADLIALNLWNEHYKQKHLSEPLPTSPLAGSQPAPSKSIEDEAEEIYRQAMQNINPEELKEVQEMLNEEKQKGKRGRPKKEPLPLNEKDQLIYWKDQVVEILLDVARGFGWEKAEWVLEEAQKEFYETKERAVK